ncbi:MAG: hypothetical protein ACI94Y_002257 [Maribacter sp.]|jgi:hypothetical protein
MSTNIFTLRKLEAILPFIVLFVLVTILLLIAATDGQSCFALELFIC